MGYTHYYKLNKAKFETEELMIVKNIIKNYKNILNKPVTTKTTILFNGKGEDSHEDFFVSPKCNEFCKTNEKPYK